MPRNLYRHNKDCTCKCCLGSRNGKPSVRSLRLPDDVWEWLRQQPAGPALTVERMVKFEMAIDLLDEERGNPPEMFDYNAPIVPGTSAAGFNIHEELSLGFLARFEDYARHLPGWRISGDQYEGPAVTLIIDDGKVSDIWLGRGYQGTYRGIGIGSTIGEVEARIAACGHDEVDDLRITGVPGLFLATHPKGCLERAESEEWRCSCFNNPRFLSWCIDEIGVTDDDRVPGPDVFRHYKP